MAHLPCSVIPILDAILQTETVSCALFSLTEREIPWLPLSRTFLCLHSTGTSTRCLFPLCVLLCHRGDHLSLGCLYFFLPLTATAWHVIIMHAESCSSHVQRSNWTIKTFSQSFHLPGTGIKINNGAITIVSESIFEMVSSPWEGNLKFRKIT